MTDATRYRYTECGLDDVIIEGLDVATDDSGEQVYCIPNVRSLHRAIAQSIIDGESGLSGKEFRFLRTEMGLSQAEMADLLNVTRVTVNRWEQGRTDIDGNAQVVIRLLAAESMGIKKEKTVEKMAKSSTPTAERGPIRIDGSNPSDYRPIAA